VQALLAFEYPVALLQPGMRDHASLAYRIASFVPTVMLFLLSAILWLSSGQFAPSPGSGPKSDETPSGITPQILQNIAFSVVGILILVNTVSFSGHIVLQSLRENPWRDPSYWLNVVDSMIRLALGSWLLFGSEGLRRFKSWLLENAKTVSK
jgi:hypothetical protein